MKRTNVAQGPWFTEKCAAQMCTLFTWGKFSVMRSTFNNSSLTQKLGSACYLQWLLKCIQVVVLKGFYRVFPTAVDTGCASVTVALFIKTSEDYFLLQTTSRSHSANMESNICSYFVLFFPVLILHCLPWCCKQIFHFQHCVALRWFGGNQFSLGITRWHTIHFFKDFTQEYHFSWNDTHNFWVQMWPVRWQNIRRITLGIKWQMPRNPKNKAGTNGRHSLSLTVSSPDKWQQISHKGKTARL